METKTTKNTQGVIFLILLSLFIWLFFFACDGEENSSEPTKKEPFTEINALVMSRDFVLKNLVSPSSAEFSTDESGVRKRSDNVFWVESYVDSLIVSGDGLHFVFDRNLPVDFS